MCQGHPGIQKPLRGPIWISQLPGILKGFNNQENPLGCVKPTAETAVILAELLKDFEQKKDTEFDRYYDQPRESRTGH